MSDRPAPYPADTRAKGWRFELDYEQIDQSGTWSAAMTAALEGLPLARPLLLAMWYAAWKQVPCGSLPSDDREMAGAIGIPFSVFLEYRDVLLRGWWRAGDGRLYHETITRRVLEMMGKRRSDADRKAAERAKKLLESGGSPTGVTPDTVVTPPAIQQESSTDHRPPKKISKASPSHPPGGGRFAEFWRTWPKNDRKQDKKACAAKWATHKFDDVADAILADVRAKRDTRKWQEGFIEAPLVYLNNRRWEDGTDSGGDEGVAEWFTTGGGIKAKGAELGVPYTAEDDCHPFDRYKARVFAKAGHSPRAAA